MKNPRVGVLAFPYHDGRVSSGSSIVSEKLTTQMASQKGIRIIERRLISKLLEEKHMEETGVIDQSTAKEIGKVLGLDVMVTGTLIDLEDDKTEINARVLSSETGEILAAEAATIERTWSDIPRHARRPIPPGKRMEEEKEVKDNEKEEKDSNELIRVGYPRGVGRMGGRYGR